MGESNNHMREIEIEKVTVNMGVGQTGQELDKACTILENITGMKPLRTSCKVRIPTWGIREGLLIGAKVTLRGKKAEEFLKKALNAKDNSVKGKSFDQKGNFGFGVKEHIDMPGVKYDPKLGIRGLDVLVTLKRHGGYRLRRRKIGKKSIGSRHSLKKAEAMEFVKKKFGVEVK
ncbi:MAG: 50S ribosomal protein L5 [Candidatus Diapherotrites archaeon]